MNLKAELLRRVEAHCARVGTSKARLATVVVNDGKFFDRIEDGGTCTLTTYENFIAYLDTAEAKPERRSKKGKTA